MKRCGALILTLLLSSSPTVAGGSPDLSSVKQIGVALTGETADPSAHLALRMVMLDLSARGYVPVDLRSLFRQDSPPPARPPVDEDSMLVLLKGNPVGALLLLDVEADSIEFEFEKVRSAGRWVTNVPRFMLEVTVIGVPGGEKLFAEDTRASAKLFRAGVSDDRYVQEPVASVIQRGILELHGSMPLCAVTHVVNVRYSIPVVLYGDQGFRELHGEKWQEVIQARMEFAAAIFRAQFQLNLVTAAIRPWASGGWTNLQVKLMSFQASVPKVRDTLFLAFVHDERNRQLELAGREVGLASFLSNVSALREVAALVDEQYWYSLKHSLVITHEIGHMLGAVHVGDRESVMHPALDFVGYRFDSLNAAILNGTRRAFTTFTYPERIRAFLPLIFSVQTWPAFRSRVMIESVRMVLDAQWEDSAGVKVRLAVLDTTLVDSALALALRGLAAFEEFDWSGARAAFTAALEKNPAYGESYVYLARTAAAEGDTEEAARYTLLARERGWEVPGR